MFDYNPDYQGSTLVDVMDKFHTFVDKYPAVWIEYPENAKGDKKRLATATMNNTFYGEVHCNFRKYSKEYGSCCLLCRGPSVVPFMIDAVAGFCYTLNVFNKLKDSIFKQNQELNKYYKDVRLKDKDVITAFISDLKLFSAAYDFEVDIKEIIPRLTDKISSLYNEDADRLFEKMA